MPSKRKKKKSAKKQEVVWDFELHFDDLTMNTTDGEYAKVKSLMDEDSPGGKWISGVVKTRLAIVSQFGESHMRLDFYPDKRVYVLGYSPSVGDMYYNPDMRCLTRWCQANGWKIPQPTENLVLSNLHFWKYMWNTLLIDSDYLDKRFGTRAALDMRNNIIIEDDEEDE